MAIEVNRIVKGHRYDTSISILLADDEPKTQKTETTTYLYRTKRGLFFFVKKYNDSLKKPKLAPLTIEKAESLFKELPQKYQDLKEAFSDPDDTLGRPTLFERPLTKTSFWLKDEMIDWLKKQPGTMSETLRNLIEDAMKKNP
jgi:hypothetical protein